MNKFKVGDKVTAFYNFLCTGTIIEVINNEHFHVQWDDVYDGIDTFCHGYDLVSQNKCADFLYEPGDRLCWHDITELSESGTIISAGLLNNIDKVYFIAWDNRTDIVKFQRECCLVFISHDEFKEKIKDRINS